jgi:hypothetical protein
VLIGFVPIEFVPGNSACSFALGQTDSGGNECRDRSPLDSTGQAEIGVRWRRLQCP